MDSFHMYVNTSGRCITQDGAKDYDWNHIGYAKDGLFRDETGILNACRMHKAIHKCGSMSRIFLCLNIFLR